MAKDVLYTNGVIAVREKSLLKDKIYKLCEGSAEDAFRILSESGFGKGAEAGSVYDYERLLSADERDLDEFIREYAPTNAEREYLLSPRDFHNAKAAFKSKFLGLGADKSAVLFAPDGLYSVSDIVSAVESGDVSALNEDLADAIKSAESLFSESEEDGQTPVTGAQTGIIFDNAMYKRLSAVCRGNLFLRKCITEKADMSNIITALRSKTPEDAADNYVCGGSVPFKTLEKLFSENSEEAAHALDKTAYFGFLKTCLEQKNSGLPLTEAERILNSLETHILKKRKYELKNSQPFLYYVFRRRAENENLRILFVCLLAGMDERAILKRLRTF